jgi:hypothetical protein
MPSWYHRLWRYVSRAPSPQQPLPASQRKRLRPKVEVLERRCLLSHSPAVTFSFVVPAGTPNEVIGPGTVLAAVPAETRKEAQLFRVLEQHPKGHLDVLMHWGEGGTVQVAGATLRPLQRSLKQPWFSLLLWSGEVSVNPAPTAGFGPGVTQVTLRSRHVPFLPRGVLRVFQQQFGQAFAGWMQSLGQFFSINIGGINVGGINIAGIDIGGVGGINIGAIDIGGFGGFGGGIG